MPQNDLDKGRSAAEDPSASLEARHTANIVMAKRCFAEMIGTAVLVIIGCGAAMGLSLGADDNYIALAIGTAFAFGLVVTALSYALGEYSGCHVNPAVTFALFLAKKIDAKQMLLYWISQVVGGILGGAVLLLIFGGLGGSDVVKTLASNTVNMANLWKSWGGKGVAPVAYSAQGWPFLFIGLFAEIFFAFVFVFTILCTGHNRENGPISGIALGLSLVSVILLGFNITGTGVNPARSIGTAVMAMVTGEFEPIKEIWIFIFGPMIGAALAVGAYRIVWHEHGAHPKAKVNKK
ncbi:MAG TPA: aquaporin [Firmicutes bacterium]|nr:aquaporin [Bacillota bacterium]